MNFTLHRSPRFPFYLALAAGFGLTAGAVLLASVLHLAACPLCIIQRMLTLTIGLWGIFGLLFGHIRAARAGLLALMVAAAGTGVFVAGFQTWLQRFAPFASCAADYPWWAEMVDWAGERVPLLFYANGSCSDPAWKLLGLSMAEWSLTAFSTLLVIFSYYLFKSLVKR
jgi:protein dithiol:quinone oxidoreductase